MTQHLGRTVPVLLAALVLVGAANLAAYAANGKPLLLGKANTATKSTKVINTGNGAALVLKSKASAPPLSVSSSKLVTRLNADRVDGLDGSQLRTTAYTYALPQSGPAASITFGLPGLPAGTYQASYSVQASFAGPATLTCGLRLAGADPNLGYARVAGDGSMTAAGVAVVDTRAGALSLRCSAGSVFVVNLAADVRSTLTLLRVDTAIIRTATD